ncbi:neuraminidase-like domain-containing protein [Pseudomonas sp. NMS19W]|uniref:Tc toxin subunit A-related protein n=1 Tax=Pseudomonas sp. NMS19W TaxID=3079768 RepID=UPI003F6571DE
MPASVDTSLRKRYLKAMVDVVVGHRLAPFPFAIPATETLSDVLLTDLEDEAKAQATDVSSTVRTLQRYIHGVYGGMERGYKNVSFDRDDQDYWWKILSNYSWWSANVLLKVHAANYIEPPLRLNKTELFRVLEGELMQRRLTDASVKVALMSYTSGFEKLSNLEVKSCYIDGTKNRNAPYYLVARSRTQPFDHYLRKVKVEVDEHSTKINPANWEEWQKCNIATTGTVVDIRGVVWLGQLALVWCEWIDRQVDGNGVVQSPWTLNIKLAFKSIDETWSAPLTLHSRKCESDVSDGWLAVFADGDGSPSDDRLRVCYTNLHTADRNGTPGGIEIHEVRDHLMRSVEGDISTSLAMVYGRFRNRNGVQQKIVPADYPKIEIKPENPPADPIRSGLAVDVVISNETRQNGEAFQVMRVRGRCTTVSEAGRVLQRLSISWRALHDDTYTHVSIQYEDDTHVTITLTTRRQPVAVHDVRLSTESAEYETVHSFAVTDFKEVAPGDRTWTAQSVVKLTDPALRYLVERTSEEIRAGAGFSVDPLGVAAVNDDNRLEQKVLYDAVPFSIGLQSPTPTDPAPSQFIAPMDGTVTSPWVVYESSVFPVDADIPVDFSADGVTVTFLVKLTARPKSYLTPTIGETNARGAQFLSFNDSSQALKHLRLGSQIAAILTSRAAVSVDALMDWDTQHVEEDPLPDGTRERHGFFYACNARYFWEVFFHIPHLVFWRLSEEGRYQEAQRWLEYIFHPLSPEVVKKPGSTHMNARPAYWLCRPLEIDHVDCSYEQLAPTDPDALGYCAPIHFMIAVFLHYIQNLIAEGDDLFRRLDYDSMVRAGLLYSKAWRMIGEKSGTDTGSTWKSQTLDKLLTAIESRDPLKAFEARLNLSLADMPMSMTGKPQLDLTGSGVFKAGVNERPAAIWDLLKSRLDNLRSNRSIDGYDLVLPLFSPMGDPRELLIAQGNGTLGSSRSPGGQVQIVPYRFQTVYELARDAVEFLIQQEDQLRSWLEMRDRNKLEELQHEHLMGLAEHTRSIHEATIAQLEATAASLRQSESMVNERMQHYERLVREGVSAAENKVIEKNRNARHIAAGVTGLEVLGAELDGLPNIGGTAFGGFRLAAIPYTGARLLQLVAEGQRGEAEEAGINESYRRRGEEWTLEYNQCRSQARVLREQILAQEHGIRAARASLELSETANTQSKEIYRFYKERSTGPDLSNWIVGQIKTLLYQLNDLCVSLCTNAERALQYETGDFKTNIIRSDAWNDTRHGFTSGAALKMGLLQLSAARIQRHERQMEITKTFSLSQLVGEDEWSNFITSGSLSFSLKESHFANDYPQHYCRQIVELTCTCPGLLGPYENLCAILMQLGSSTMLQPDIDTFKYLYDDSGEPTPGALVQNLRPYQQIGLSRGVDDNGIVDRAPSDRLLPFEGTGVHGNYKITFPRPTRDSQANLLQSLTDFILTVSYRARDGGPLFGSAVEAVLAAPRQPPKKRLATQAGKVRP